jgi:hypothetical protein
MNRIQKKYQKEDKFINLICFLIIGLSCYTINRLIEISLLGIDLTDEGMYLNWIASPRPEWPNISNFGYLFHPIYLLLNANLFVLRITNIFFIFCISGLVGIKYLNLVGSKNQTLSLSTLEKISIFMVFGTSGILVCTVDGSWLSTPSYNTANYIGILLLLLGILSLQKEKKKIVASINSLSCGIGMTMMILAKPTTGILIYAIFIMATIKFRSLNYSKTLIYICIITALMLMSFSSFTLGAPNKLFNDWLTDSRIVTKLSPEYSLTGIFKNVFLSLLSNIYFTPTLVLIITIAVGIVIQKITQVKFNRTISILRIVELSLFVNTLAWGRLKLEYLFLGLLLINFVFLLKLCLKAKKQIKHNLIQLGFLTAAPFVFSIGTARNLLSLASTAVLFLVVAILMICKMYTTNMNGGKIYFSTIVFVINILTLSLVHNAIERPYRQPQSNEDTRFVANFNSKIDQRFEMRNQQKFFHLLGNILKNEETTFRTKFIDLTGQSPGLIYLLNGDSLGSAWLLGGYSGSNIVAAELLSRENCFDLASAIVVFEENGERSLSVNIFQELGLMFPSNYKEILKIEISVRKDIYESPRYIHFYEPEKFESNIDLCRSKRLTIKGQEGK